MGTNCASCVADFLIAIVIGAFRQDLQVQTYLQTLNR